MEDESWESSSTMNKTSKEDEIQKQSIVGLNSKKRHDNVRMNNVTNAVSDLMKRSNQISSTKMSLTVQHYDADLSINTSNHIEAISSNFITEKGRKDEGFHLILNDEKTKRKEKDHQIFSMLKRKYMKSMHDSLEHKLVESVTAKKSKLK
jgi:hypothetical protein